ncbi:MAG: hypothetical protein HQL30_09490 [Candidatus Omnitrophica bacterium]|nr:hypothetical protein [Candidatus Omnitrophota bacterium]
MKARKIDPDNEKKEMAAYALLYYFMTSFLAKTVIGILSGSQYLVTGGIFVCFGIFTAVVELLRLGRIYSPRGARSGINYGKLEFAVIVGVSAIIALSTGSFLFSLVHILFFHTLYPSGLSGAWMALGLGGLNLGISVWFGGLGVKLSAPGEKNLNFLLRADLVLSALAAFVIVTSRMGAYILDYSLALLTTLLVMGYSVSFLGEAFKGLMDAACDKGTVAKVEKLLRDSDPGVVLDTLRVNRVGHVLEVIAGISFPGDASIKDAVRVVSKVKSSLNGKLAEPSEIFVGIKER